MINTVELEGRKKIQAVWVLKLLGFQPSGRILHRKKNRTADNRITADGHMLHFNGPISASTSALPRSRQSLAFGPKTGMSFLWWTSEGMAEFGEGITCLLLTLFATLSYRYLLSLSSRWWFYPLFQVCHTVTSYRSSDGETRITVKRTL